MSNSKRLALMGSMAPLKLPIIDFSKENLKPGTSDWNLVCNDVRRALEDYGCFEAVYDNVTVELHNSIFGLLEDLFNLPMETKHRNIISEKPYFGYLGNLKLDPLYEGMGIYDVLVIEEIQSFINLMWPEGNASFCEILHSYSKRVSELDKMVQRMVFESLGLEKYYNSHVESTHYLFRMMTYKPPKTNEPTVGADCHTDKSFISILHQNHVNALEVQTKNGEWIQVTPAASSFIVMIGDLFHAWSNGRLHSPVHRAMMSGDERRYSLGLFSYSEHITQCPEELVDEQHPLLFKPFDHIDLLNFTFTDEGRKVESALKTHCGL